MKAFLIIVALLLFELYVSIEIVNATDLSCVIAPSGIQLLHLKWTITYVMDKTPLLWKGEMVCTRK